MSFSVLTLNLWNANKPLEARFSALARGLKMLRPDIICLQEADRDPQSARSQTELIAEMSNLAQHEEKSRLSILCRHPIVRTSSVELPEFPGDGPRQILFTEILMEGRPILVANTHLASRAEMVQERKAQVETLLAAIMRYHSEYGAVAKLLCGDFNDVPNSPAVRMVMDSSERFQDAYGQCCPNSPGFTYSRKNPYVDPTSAVDQRIDYIFTSSELVPKECSVVFDGNSGLDFVSDHFGVFCSLVFR